jgi:hypothetical protein
METVTESDGQLKTKPSENGEVRFSIKRWARELQTITQPGLSKALHKAGQMPDAQGRYSTAQIRETLWGKAYQERINLLRAKTEAIKQKTAQMMAGLIPVAEIPKHNRAIYGALTEEINSWTILDQKQKANLLRHLPKK